MSSRESRLTYPIEQDVIVSCSLAVLSPTGGVYMGLRTGGSNPNTANRWRLPGGKKNSGETILQAAMRETYEELGIETKITSDPVLYNAYTVRDGRHAGKAFLGFVATAEPFSTDGLPVIPTPLEDTADVKVMSLDEICELGEFCSQNALRALSILGMQLDAPNASESLWPPTPPLGRDLRGAGLFEATKAH